jgi:hypothetical protein
MTPASFFDLSFLVTLLPKMAIVALLVVTATVASEKLGPVIGALIATLPVTSGPVFVFLALNHDSAFIARTALSVFSQNVPTVIFAAFYVLAARHLPTRLSVPLSILVWAGYIVLSLWGDQSLPTAMVLTLMVFPLCILLTLPYGGVAVAAGRVEASDIVIRAVVVALLVAAVEIAGLVAGAELTGVIAAFPIVFICMMVILQMRHGGPAAAAVIAHTIPGFAGISAAFLALHLCAVPLGTPAALILALCVSVFWNLALFALHRSRAAGASQIIPSVESSHQAIRSPS